MTKKTTKDTRAPKPSAKPAKATTPQAPATAAAKGGAKPAKGKEPKTPAVKADAPTDKAGISEVLLDKLLKLARAQKGVLTYDELNKRLPAEMTPDAIDEVISALEKNKVRVLEIADPEEDDVAVIPDEEEAVVAAAMIPFGCICAKWVMSNCFHAMARLKLLNGLKLAVR